MSDHDHGKTLLFVDNSFAFKGMNHAGFALSWERLLGFIQSKRGPIYQTYFFGTETDPPQQKQTNFFRHLKFTLNFELILGVTKQRRLKGEVDENGNPRSFYVEKGLDVNIVTTMLSLLLHNAFDRIILFAGDAVLAPACEEVKRWGKKIEIIGWENSVSAALLTLSTHQPCIILNEFENELEKNDDYQL